MHDKILELEKEYFEDCAKAGRKFKDSVMETLKGAGLDGLVRRKYDGAYGWLRFNQDLRLCFYKQKKDGSMSVFSSEPFCAVNVADEFEKAEL